MHRIACTVAVIFVAAVASSAQTQSVPRGHNLFTVIQGNALNANNAPLTRWTVRLRDARSGRIADTESTDRAGLFTFRPVDPGSYVVELIGSDRAVAAASQILNVGSGESVTAIVKLPFRVAPYAGVLGHSAPQAALISAAAAASGVLGAAVVGAQSTCTNGGCSSSGR